MDEELKPIPGFKGYFVSTNGDVFSDKKKNRHKLVDSRKNKVGLYPKPKQVKHISRANLVALTFLNRPLNDSKSIEYKNGDPNDYYLENLSWIANKKSLKLPKPILQYDLEENFIQRFESIEEAVNKVDNTNKKNIRRCANGETKSSAGYVWKYSDDETNIVNGEEVRQIDGYESYRISESGILYSVIGKAPTPKLVNGKNSITSKINGNKNTFKIDVLVAEAFIGPRINEDDLIVHLDGDDANDHYTNLRWISFEDKYIHEGNDNGIRWRTIYYMFPEYRIYENGRIFSKYIQDFMTYESENLRHHSITLVNFDGEKEYINILELLALAFLDPPTDETYTYIVPIDGDYKNYDLNNIIWWNEPEFVTDRKKWETIPGEPNYLINEYGEIKSYSTGKPVILNQHKKRTGYKKITLNGKNKSIARLTLSAHDHQGELEDLLQADHKNRIRDHNHIDNLRWATEIENAANRKIPKKKTKPIFQFNLNDEEIDKFESASEAVEKLKLNITERNIRDCANGKFNSFGGFKWKFATYEPKEGEIFKPLVGKFFDDVYDFPDKEISNYGTLINSKTGIAHSIVYSGRENPFVCGMYIKRLVANFFVKGRTKERNQVGHIDKNYKNFQFDNLVWETHSEMMSRLQGRSVHQINIETDEILNTFSTIGNALTHLGISTKKTQGISNVCNGKNGRLTAHKYKWKWNVSK